LRELQQRDVACCLLARTGHADNLAPPLREMPDSPLGAHALPCEGLL
jgi:hypothetical protein